MRLLLVLVATVSLFAQSREEIINALPSAERWRVHFEQELIPFWMTEAAQGSPRGVFPSTRCDDGSALDFARPCAEIRGNAWLMTPQRYLVSQSRQTYGYGVMFHVTGDRRYLDLMKAGVDYIRREIVDRERGGMFTLQNLRTNQWGPRMELRNPQELAYGLLGLAFYYYLTRDAEVLPDILAVRDHQLYLYWQESTNALRWMLMDDGPNKADDLKLVAQLDQMNAYMVMMTPLLPERDRAIWTSDLVWLSRLIIERFYSAEQNLVFLAGNSEADRDITKVGTDFGHTIKAMWMIRFAGLLSGERDLVEFAERNGPRVLERAWIESSGSWAQEVLKGGVINPDKSWWIYAELDQFAATMALGDARHAKYLPRSYDYWFRYFVDPRFGEVWTGVNARDNSPQRDLPKAWPWKNAYHSLEHALVGLITTQQLKGAPVTLHYAFPNEVPADVQPYFYRGRVESQAQRDGVWAITFRDVR